MKGLFFMQKNSNEDKKYWAAFSKINGIGSKKIIHLSKQFPTMQAAWSASFQQLKQAGLTHKDASLIAQARDIIDPENVWLKIQELQINVITIADASYPAPLKEIFSPPAVLYLKGYLQDSWNLILAVVGTRNTTSYGRQVTPTIVEHVTKAGIAIVSGMALGIDTIAHRSSVDSGGHTIAVLGSGIDILYPRTNTGLAQDILNSGGALISEYPPGTEPHKQHFPARNRIISGLSRGVLVIEGGEDSGSLITARCALDQNREIMAVPGNILQNTAKGPNSLIKMGASVITCAADILEIYNIKNALSGEKAIIKPETDEEKLIVSILVKKPLHIDEILQACTLETSIISSTLAIMEMKGMVKNLGGKYYTLLC